MYICPYLPIFFLSFYQSSCSSLSFNEHTIILSYQFPWHLDTVFGKNYLRFNSNMWTSFSLDGIIRNIQGDLETLETLSSILQQLRTVHESLLKNVSFSSFHNCFYSLQTCIKNPKKLSYSDIWVLSQLKLIHSCQLLNQLLKFCLYSYNHSQNI